MRASHSLARIFVLFVLTFIMASASESRVQGPPWPEGPYPYTVIDQDLVSVLREFGKNAGLRLDISDKIKGRVRTKAPQGSAKEFFLHICKVYGLEWYYDGFTLHVTPSSENVTSFLDIGSISLDDLQGELERLDLYEPRFPLRLSTNNRSVLVSGPPRYVSIVSQTLSRMSAPAFSANMPIPSQTVIYRGSGVSIVSHTAAPAPIPQPQ